jgi:hypothetical protein
MVIMLPKSMAGNFMIENFTVEISRGRVHISGRNASENIFNITDMIVKKFSPGFVIAENDSVLEVTWMSMPQPEMDPSIFSNILNFTWVGIGNTTYATNNIWLKNVGKNKIKIYVCGENYPGIIEFSVMSGTRIFGRYTLPECDSSQPFNNGIQIAPKFNGIVGIPSGKEIEIYNSRITYYQNYTEGSLNFSIAIA